MSNPFDSIPVKHYIDGTVGSYIGPCSRCGSLFQGHKRDYLCGPCEKEQDPLKEAWGIVEDFGQVAYEGYCKSSENKSLVTQQTLPPWDRLPAPIKRAWGCAAEAILDKVGIH